MNKLIFDKYMHESVNIVQKIKIPQLEYKKSVPQFGKKRIPLKYKDFLKFKQRFTEKTL